MYNLLMSLAIYCVVYFAGDDLASSMSVHNAFAVGWSSVIIGEFIVNILKAVLKETEGDLK